MTTSAANAPMTVSAARASSIGQTGETSIVCTNSRAVGVMKLGGGEDDGVLLVPEDHNTEEGHRAARWVVCSDSVYLGTQPSCGGYS